MDRPERRPTFKQVVETTESEECLQGVDIEAFRAYQVGEMRLEEEALADAGLFRYEVLKAQADSGDVQSQLDYANKPLSGEHIPKDSELAYKYLLRAEDAGDLEAKVKIGDLLLPGVVGADQPKMRRSAAYKRFDSVRRAITDPKNGYRLHSLFQLGWRLQES
jgi:TPR repeat protein